MPPPCHLGPQKPNHCKPILPNASYLVTFTLLGKKKEDKIQGKSVVVQPSRGTSIIFNCDSLMFKSWKTLTREEEQKLKVLKCAWKKLKTVVMVKVLGRYGPVGFCPLAITHLRVFGMCPSTVSWPSPGLNINIHVAFSTAKVTLPHPSSSQNGSGKAPRYSGSQQTGPRG